MAKQRFPVDLVIGYYFLKHNKSSSKNRFRIIEKQMHKELHTYSAVLLPYVMLK